MPLLCGARRKRGRGFCRGWAVPGSRRCRFHGGAPGSGRHLTEDAAHSVSLGKARAAVRRRPAAGAQAGGRANAATAARAANGRFVAKPKPATPRVRVKVVAKALTRVKRAMSEREYDRRDGTLPAIADKPWSEMTKAERLSTATDLALGIAKEILEL